MSKKIIVFDPDTEKEHILDLSDEDADQIGRDPQLARTRIAEAETDRATRQADLDEMRGAKVDALIQSLTDDLAAIDAATAQERINMQKRTMRAVRLLLRAMKRTLK